MKPYFQLKWTILFLSLFVFMLIVSCTSAIVSTSTPVRQEWDSNDLQQVVDEWRVRSGVPGMVVGISLPGQAEIFVASGESNVEDQVPVKTDDQFRIAS